MPSMLMRAVEPLRNSLPSRIGRLVPCFWYAVAGGLCALLGFGNAVDLDRPPNWFAVLVFGLASLTFFALAVLHLSATRGKRDE